ncbi:MAG TPA: VOC family protein [Nitrososphaerales archaeon]|nr:VOC family protein [Nitrososphaerales archaeon]
MVSKEFSVAVMVSDAKKTSKWFEDVVGLESSAEGHWVLVWPKGASTKIHLCEGKPDPGNTGIAFYDEDVIEKAQKMKEKGVKFTRDVKKTDWGTNGMFADADGNEYYLIEGTGP